MKLIPVLLLCLVSIVACQRDTDSSATTTETMDTAQTETTAVELAEPRAEKRPHEMTMHGDTRVDNYYWLRDDDRADPEMLAYLESENAWFDKEMEHTEALQETLFEEMTARLDPVDSDVPYEKGGYWYYSRFVPEEDYKIYARRKGSMDAEEEIIVDGNRRADGHDFYNLGNLEMSDDQRYAALVEDTIGRRQYEIRILDTETGEFLPDVITNAETGIAWSADGKYLFYMDKHPETLLGYRAMRHEVGTDSSDDVLVYEETDTTFYNGLGRSRSGDYIMIGHFETETTEYKLLRADDPLGEFQVFLTREPGHEYNIDHAGDTFFIRTNWDAENFRVMTATLENSQDKSSWQELIPARDTAMVQSIQAFDDFLVVGERQDGLRKVRVMSLDGETDQYLDAGMEVYVMYPETNVSTDTTKVRYGLMSMVTPSQVWEIDVATGETELLKTTRVLGDFDSLNYRTQAHVHHGP